jgi:hypothetical protein
MPDRRTHRGPHPDDADLFGDGALPAMREAAGDLVWLLNRGYAFDAATKLVGDRFQLRARQRHAVMRSVCTDASLARRLARRVDASALAGCDVRVDGFNVLTTVEAALGGALVLRGRDGCYRDLAGVHGSYRQIAETMPAIELVGAWLERARVRECRWYLDAPVSNSGRLRATLLGVARDRGWQWEVELPFNADATLREPGPAVATADGAILDAASRSVNLAREVIDQLAPRAWVVSLFPDA